MQADEHITLTDCGLVRQGLMATLSRAACANRAPAKRSRPARMSFLTLLLKHLKQLDQLKDPGVSWDEAPGSILGSNPHMTHFKCCFSANVRNDTEREWACLASLQGCSSQHGTTLVRATGSPLQKRIADITVWLSSSSYTVFNVDL